MRSETIGWAVAATLVMLAGGAAAKEKPPVTDPATLKATGEARRCIPNRNNISTQPAGDSALMFRDGASSWYRNDLRGKCPGLKQDRTLVFRRASDQYCELDTFEMVDTMSGMRFGVCVLGKFTPVEVPKDTRF